MKRNKFSLALVPLFLSIFMLSGCFLSSDAPSDLTATVVSSGKIELAWTDNSDQEHGFIIQRRKDGKRFKKLAKVDANVVSYTDTDLEENTTYYYRVRAYFKRFKTFFSNIATATTSNLNISTQPEITLPGEYDQWDLTVDVSEMPVPSKINIHYVPVGDIYEIGLAGVETPDFGDDYAVFRYSYDKTQLSEAGLIEDFMVFYYDENEELWKPLERIEVDTDNSQVIVYTSHFTPFVLTAIPSASGTVTDPPPCILGDFPSGIGGSGSAVFTIVDDNFKYYQDRDYFIRAVSVSTENTTTFGALGFDKALGISTYNGSAPYTDHKLYDGDDYIVFAAHTDIDVYVMYDTRGGVDRFDTSEDAPWLAGEGFVNTGYFLETTDAVQYYTVYKKSYNQGEEVHLHGNRKGVTDPAINTNYWVIVKLQGDSSCGYASDLCVATPDTTPPALVTNLNAAAGAGQVTLTWQNPDDTDFAGVVIRRSTVAPPMGINDDDEPTGDVISPQCFRDTGVSAGITYYYTVFSLDANNNYDIGESISITTSVDTDGDGLSDDYENTTVYPGTGLTTDPNLADSDGDGTDDGIEITLGTDPTNPDNTRPEITDFTRTSDSPTGDPTITYSLDGTDDTAITGWMVTKTDTKPLSNNTNWQGTLPTSYTFTPKPPPGAYNLYAWAKDAAGNVSNLYTALDVEIIRLWTRKGGVISSPYVFASTGFIPMQAHNSEPYVVYGGYNRVTGEHEICVKFWDGTSWVQLGSIVDSYAGYYSDLPYPSISFDNLSPYVVYNKYEDTTGKYYVIVKRWDGTNWVQLGGYLNIDPARTGRCASIIIIGSTPYVVWLEYTIGGSYYIFAKHWDGSNWIQDGGNININTAYGSGIPSISSNGTTPYVTWREYDGDSSYVNVKHFDGTNWIQDGDSLNITTSQIGNIPTISFINSSPYVAWDEDDQMIYTKRWDGFSWVQVGDTIESTDVTNKSIRIATDGINPYLAISGSISYVVYWDGANWIQLGENISSSGGKPLSNSTGINQLLFIDSIPYVVATTTSSAIKFQSDIYIETYE